MMETGENKVKTDRAWNKLYTRLESEGLLRTERRRFICSPLIFKWAGAAAVTAVCICIAAIYFNEERPSVKESLLVKENREISTLVTTLEDGSVVYLGTGTSLYYPEHFLPDKRKVALQGTALFDIAGNSGRPFLIETEEVLVEVLGTAFNVKSDAAVPFELSVQRGKVKVCLKKSGQEAVVEAGRTVTLMDRGLLLSANEDTGQFTRYLGKMRFKDELLGNVIRVINLHASDIVLRTSPSLRERRLTVAFSDESPESVAELICLAMNLRCTREGNIITLSE